MTVGQALERAEELRPGSRVSVHTRQEWLREADGMLRERFFKASDTDAFDTCLLYTSPSPRDTR